MALRGVVEENLGEHDQNSQRIKKFLCNQYKYKVCIHLAYDL